MDNDNDIMWAITTLALDGNRSKPKSNYEQFIGLIEQLKNKKLLETFTRTMSDERKYSLIQICIRMACSEYLQVLLYKYHINPNRLYGKKDLFWQPMSCLYINSNFLFDIEIIRMLIDCGASPDVIADYRGCGSNNIGTPLYYACVSGNLIMVNKLLSYGHANPNIYFVELPHNMYSETPLDYMLEHDVPNKHKIVNLLISYGAHKSDRSRRICDVIKHRQNEALTVMLSTHPRLGKKSVFDRYSCVDVCQSIAKWLLYNPYTLVECGHFGLVGQVTA